MKIDSQYTTSSELENKKYELIKTVGNPSGTVENTQDINVTYIYKIKKSKVIVKYLDVTDSPTGTPLPSIDGSIVKDIEIDGLVEEQYTTNSANNVQQNYELVEKPNNSEGVFGLETITVIYKYKKLRQKPNKYISLFSLFFSIILSYLSL